MENNRVRIQISVLGTFLCVLWFGPQQSLFGFLDIKVVKEDCNNFVVITFIIDPKFC